MMPNQPTEAPTAEQTRARRGSVKFLYPSGAKPLSGYTIKRGIGVGGFGEVYYATSDGGKEVALKRIQRNLDIELRGVSQCLNLKHPNLVTLYDIRYDEEDQAWVVMEFVGGENLQEVIERNPNGLPVDQVRHWIRGLAAGVAYLHDHGIVHRDLKPGNIFMDQGVVKIGDYGLAKFISCSRRSGQTESVGTFHYMAPEIGRGRYGREIDIYAMGILLYEMLTGRVPYEGESSQEIIMKHLTAQPDLSGLRDPFRGVIKRALAKDPEHRYGTVEGMLHEMQLHNPDGGMFYVPPPAPLVAEAVAAPGGRPSAGPGAATSPGTPENEAVPGGAFFASAAAAKRDVRTIVQADAVGTPEGGSLSNEPIARSIQLLLSRLKFRWERANFNTPMRFVLLLIGVMLFIMNSAWIVPTSFFLGTIYAGYLMVWMLLAPGIESPPARAYVPPPLPQPRGATPKVKTMAEPVASLPRRLSVSDKVRISRRVLHQRPWLDRATDLVGSMILSALVVAVVSILMLVVGSSGLGTSLYSWAPTYLWMALTSLAGTWIVLAQAKYFETSEGDPVLRRFSMLVGGMVLGVIATGLASALQIEGPNYLLNVRPTLAMMPATLYAPDGSPRILAGIGYFGALLGLLRWWRQGDSLRDSRLSVVSTAGCVLTAVLMYLVMPYPRGFLIAATMAMATQISAPWINPRDREQMIASGVPVSHYK
jgi:hypothetical protein